MIVLPDDVTLFSVQRNAQVQAKLVRLTRDLAAKQIDGAWWSLEVSKTIREKEDDHHWLWRKVVGEHQNHRSWEAVAVQSANGEVEGAITYRIDAKSQLNNGTGAVYVDRIAAAPRNRPWLVSPPSYRGVGTVLLLAAVRHSYSLGLGGQVWLSSLPSERTRQFYANKRFEVIFNDDNGMLDLELPTASAVAWLEAEGYL